MHSKTYTLSFLVAVAAVSLVVVQSALAASEALPSSAVYRKRAVVTVPTTQTSVPQIVEFSIPSSLTKNGIEVVAAKTMKRVGVQERTQVISQMQKPSIIIQGVQRAHLSDGNERTAVDFPVTLQTLEGGVPQLSTVTIRYEQPQVVSGIQFAFETYSARPEIVSVLADGQAVIRAQKFTASTVVFPFRQVTELTVLLTHTQPLRLTEMTPVADSLYSVQESTFRFLGQPQETYFVYLDRNTLLIKQNDEKEAGHLFTGKAAAVLGLLNFQKNPEYSSADSDDDTIADDLDNCPQYANAEQLDEDMSAIGDACEDFDFDTVANAVDNCPAVANVAQIDTDGDSEGDSCDSNDSRLTEQYPVLPWLALGVTAVVIAGLFVALLRSKNLPYNSVPNDRV